MLLSADERKSLDKDERKALRAERRAKRSKDRGPFLGIKLDVLKDLASDLILDLVSDTIPGEEKLGEVIDDLADQADKFLKWNGLPGWLKIPLEAVDGTILQSVARGTLEPHVQRIYEELKAAGKL